MLQLKLSTVKIHYSVNCLFRVLPKQECGRNYSSMFVFFCETWIRRLVNLKRNAVRNSFLETAQQCHHARQNVCVFHGFPEGRMCSNMATLLLKDFLTVSLIFIAAQFSLPWFMRLLFCKKVQVPFKNFIWVSQFSVVQCSPSTDFSFASQISDIFYFSGHTFLFTSNLKTI